MPAALSASSISSHTSACAATYLSTLSGFTRRTNPRRSVILFLLDDHHNQVPGTVHALDALELDVGRRGRARHECQRTESEILQRIERLRHGLHDLARPDDAEMEVGHEGQ